MGGALSSPFPNGGRLGRGEPCPREPGSDGASELMLFPPPQSSPRGGGGQTAQERGFPCRGTRMTGFGCARARRVVKRPHARAAEQRPRREYGHDRAQRAARSVASRLRAGRRVRHRRPLRELRMPEPRRGGRLFCALPVPLHGGRLAPPRPRVRSRRDVACSARRRARGGGGAHRGRSLHGRQVRVGRGVEAHPKPGGGRRRDDGRPSAVRVPPASAGTPRPTPHRPPRTDRRADAVLLRRSRRFRRRRTNSGLRPRSCRARGCI